MRMGLDWGGSTDLVFMIERDGGGGGIVRASRGQGASTVRERGKGPGLGHSYIKTANQYCCHSASLSVYTLPV